MKKLFTLFCFFYIATEIHAQCVAGFTFTVSYDTVWFTNTSTGNGPTYSWDFGDGNSSSITNPSHIYQNTGSYSVCLSIQDSLSADTFCNTVIITTMPPISTAWIQKADFPSTGRQWPIGFSIGNKGYMGMGLDGPGYANDLWEYDPISNSWTQKANLGVSGRYGAVSFVIGNKAYVGLGYGGSYKNDLWEYNPASNTWAQKANFGGTARYCATGFAIGNKGYIGCGYDGGVRKDFWEYDPSSNTWIQKTNFPGAARNAAAGFSLGNKGYLGTGYDMNSTWFRDFWQYDPSTNTWLQKANFGGVIRSSCASFVLNGKGYFGEGEHGGLASYTDFWGYDTTANTWATIPNFSGSARGRAAGFAIGNYYAYVGCGGAPGYYNDFWQYSACNISTPVISMIGNDTVCQNDSILLSSSDTSSNQQWYFNNTLINGSTNQNYYAKQSGQYSVLSGCSSLSSAVTVAILSNTDVPSICIVTVDSTINKNKIVWEKLTTQRVISYNIYKETQTAGVYAQIGNNPTSVLSEFVDTSSSPWQVAARYKISSVDSCGNESAKSQNHKTIHLVISLGIFPAINLQWDDYEGITFGKYRIWRRNSSSSLSLIDSVQSTLHSYTDINPPAGTNYYVIEIIYPQGCNPTRVSSSAILSNSLSNVSNTATMGINEYYNNSSVSIYPNPFSETTTLRITNGNRITNYSLAVTDIYGQIVYSDAINNANEFKIHRNDLPTGMYFYKISGEGAIIATGKLVIE